MKATVAGLKAITSGPLVYCTYSQVLTSAQALLTSAHLKAAAAHL